MCVAHVMVSLRLIIPFCSFWFISQHPCSFHISLYFQILLYVIRYLLPHTDFHPPPFPLPQKRHSLARPLSRGYTNLYFYREVTSHNLLYIANLIYCMIIIIRDSIITSVSLLKRMIDTDIESLTTV